MNTVATSIEENILNEDILEIQETALNAPIIQDQNPLAVRWGIQLAVRHMPLDARECGLPKAPFGRFFPIASFPAPREHHTIDWTKPREEMTVIQAAYCESFLREALGGAGAQNQTNWGLQTGFVNDEDAAKMAVITATLLPSLSEIRSIQEQLTISVISPVCEAVDDLDFGEREQCVTCWSRWLNSVAIVEHIRNVATTGRIVNSRNPQTGEIDRLVVKPSLQDFETALELARAAMRQGMRQLETQWRVIAREMESVPGRQVSDFEHEYRKDLHKAQPEDRQLAVVRDALNARQNAPAGAPVDAVIQEFQRSQATMAQTLERLTDIVLADRAMNTGTKTLASEPVELEAAEIAAANAPLEGTEAASPMDRMQNAGGKNKSKGA